MHDGHSRDHTHAASLSSFCLRRSIGRRLLTTMRLLQPVLRLYAVPANAFAAEEEDEEAGFEGDDAEA